MTELQYYFPYFFQLDTFNKDLKQFGLSSYVTYNSKTQLPDDLLIASPGTKEPLLTIPFGATLMVQGDKLFYWKTDYDFIDITQVELNHLSDGTNFLNSKIDLTNLSSGHNAAQTDLDFKNLVTFVRKEDLKYPQDYYEKFVIVIINRNDIHIIPFDWFNKTGGDYGYVWPATARLDTAKCKLHGQGMRMADFTVQLDKPCL
jgi:hypothetical protein